jgi:hypothetical protein
MLFLGALGFVATVISGFVWLDAAEPAARSFSAVVFIASVSLIAAAVAVGASGESSPRRARWSLRLAKVVMGAFLVASFIPWVLLASMIVVVLAAAPALVLLPMVLIWSTDDARANGARHMVPARAVLRHA